MNKLIVICGPTATGKSALAVELAKIYNGEVISADSRQVYRELDIGTAKITESEMDGIPHHMIDIIHPNEYFSVADFQKMARQKIAEIHARGKLPIICGGTGMYIDATVFGTEFPEVLPNPELRNQLEQKTTKELFSELQNLDPERSTTIDKNNKVRLIRAIEIATSLGSVPKRPAVIPDQIRYPEFKDMSLDSGSESGMTTTYTTLWIGLNLPKEILQQRIIGRIDARIPALFDEIKNLHSQGVSLERLESFGLEYRYGSEYVQGKISLVEFKETLATKTWQFAKRQMTWFKRNPEIHWLDPITDQQNLPAGKAGILQLVKSFIK